jgi:hypothetical protein
VAGVLGSHEKQVTLFFLGQQKEILTVKDFAAGQSSREDFQMALSRRTGWKLNLALAGMWTIAMFALVHPCEAGGGEADRFLVLPSGRHHPK